jgi:LPXTG-motif cell wall-anchored protein
VKKNVKGATENGVDEGGYQSKAAQLHLIGFWVPLLSLILGLLLLGAVGFLQTRRRTEAD